MYSNSVVQLLCHLVKTHFLSDRSAKLGIGSKILPVRLLDIIVNSVRLSLSLGFRST